MFESTIEQLSEAYFHSRLKELRDLRDQIQSCIQGGNKTKSEEFLEEYATKIRELKCDVEKHVQIVEKFLVWFETNKQSIEFFL